MLLVRAGRCGDVVGRHGDNSSVAIGVDGLGGDRASRFFGSSRSVGHGSESVQRVVLSS